MLSVTSYSAWHTLFVLVVSIPTVTRHNCVQEYLRILTSVAENVERLIWKSLNSLAKWPATASVTKPWPQEGKEWCILAMTSRSALEPQVTQVSNCYWQHLLVKKARIIKLANLFQLLPVLRMCCNLHPLLYSFPCRGAYTREDHYGFPNTLHANIDF